MESQSSRVYLMVAGVCVALCLLAGCANQSGATKDMTRPAMLGETAAAWPIVTPVAGGTVTVYQPQLEKFEKAMFSGRVAVAVQLEGRPQQAYGTAWINSRDDVRQGCQDSDADGGEGCRREVPRSS